MHSMTVNSRETTPRFNLIRVAAVRTKTMVSNLVECLSIQEVKIVRFQHKRPAGWWIPTQSYIRSSSVRPPSNREWSKGATTYWGEVDQQPLKTAQPPWATLIKLCRKIRSSRKWSNNSCTACSVDKTIKKSPLRRARLQSLQRRQGPKCTEIWELMNLTTVQ